MTTLQKMPHADNVGQNKKYLADNFHKSITQLAGPGQVKVFHADGDLVKRRRVKEKPRVYKAQLIRVRRQIKAFRQFGSIDLWPLIPAEVGTDG